ncbi:MAG: hypothetical protein B6244_08340 [Candidatus Cloacimonetes bacterium 4572_55]|nr:MAG: hypothetical protein B6244_08340 [Candidatus Cloacimonetes bacterium 4572_55]
MEGTFQDRQHPRIASLNLVCFTRYDEKGFPVYENIGRTKDLSAGGILLECNQNFPICAQLEIVVAAHEQLVTAMGEVKRVEAIPGSKKFDVGIKFIKISERNRESINKFLEREII